MYDADLDALAAEYVLGTLAADERAHAESRLRVDPGFVEIVHQWERRLGELNVMVEAVEPPREVWEKIKSEIGGLAPAEEVQLAPLDQSEATAEEKPEQELQAQAGAKDAGEKDGGEDSPYLAALASSLLTSEADGETKPPDEADEKPEAKTEAETEIAGGAEPDSEPADQTRPPASDAQVARNADVFYLARRVRRWRRIALVSGLIALLLALFIGVSQIDPDLLPGGGLGMPQLFSFSPASPASERNNLVAVLQQEPMPPAFLLTLDPASRTLSVRRVAARADQGHAYELWVLATPSSRPRSLGLVGASEFTRRPLPAGFNPGAMRRAQFEISFEPAAGSRTSAPSGPVLFRGMLVESVPPSPPAAAPPGGS